VVTRKARGRVPSAEAGLVGSLETLPIGDLVKILNICRKSGRLLLERAAEHADLYFVDGELRHAMVAGVAGEPAFYRIMEWTDASFSFESGRKPPLVSIPGPTMTLLMEGMRLLDERRRGESPSP